MTTYRAEEAGYVPPAEEEAGEKLFTRHRVTDLARMDMTYRWTATGLLIDPTYGQVAGEMKSLKSYVSAFLDLAIATGTPVFGQWHVPERRPVVAYVGEGGKVPFTRRLVRIAQALGVNLDDAEMETTFDVAPMDTTTFTHSLERDLTELRPALVHIDPLYAYHGITVDARSLHQEGALLSGLSARCMEAGSSLLITNHFNQTGTGTGLTRITQAGSGEWVDSWLLLKHREKPDVDAGDFKLLLEVGSRQWGGSTWDIDLHIGRFDPELGTHDGAITWEVGRHDESGATADGEDRTERAILDRLRDEPFLHTQSKVIDLVGGNKDRARSAFDRLEKRKRIRERSLPAVEGNRTVVRPRWAVSDYIAPDELGATTPTDRAELGGVAA